MIEEALAEYEAFCAGRLSHGAGRIDTEDGCVQFCGAFEDPLHWTVAYVREEDRSVTPLAVGDQQSVLRVFRRLDTRGAEFGEPRRFPPPIAVIGGAAHRFQAAEGRHLVGVVRAGPAGVLLVAVDGALAVMHVEGGATTILHAGPARGPMKVDVDLALRLARPQRQGAAGAGMEESVQARPVRPSPKTRAHHLRIAGTPPIDAGGGPALEVVLRGCFGDIARRAEKLPPRRKGEKRRGLTVLEALLDCLCVLALEGCGDLVGVRRVIAGKLRARFAEFEISDEALSDAFALLLRVGTCIAVRQGLKWTIRLAGLGDPRSELHRQLCKETEQGGWIREHAGGGTGSDARVVRRAGRKSARAATDGATPGDGAEAACGDDVERRRFAPGPGRQRRPSRTRAEEPMAPSGDAGEPETQASNPASKDRSGAGEIPQGRQQEWLLHMISEAASLAVRKALAEWRAEKVVWEAERAELLARLARAEVAADVAVGVVGGAEPQEVSSATPPAENGDGACAPAETRMSQDLETPPAPHADEPSGCVASPDPEASEIEVALPTSDPDSSARVRTTHEPEIELRPSPDVEPAEGTAGAPVERHTSPTPESPPDPKVGSEVKAAAPPIDLGPPAIPRGRHLARGPPRAC